MPEKGKTFAGEVREETVAWSKDTYQLLKQAEQSKRAASRVKPTEPDRAGKQSAQRSVGDVERELRGIDEAVKSRTSEGRAEQAEMW